MVMVIIVVIIIIIIIVVIVMKRCSGKNPLEPSTAHQGVQERIP